MITYHTNTPILFLVTGMSNASVQVFSQIRKMKPDKLYIAADDPVQPGEKAMYEKIDEIASSVDWDCKVFTYPMDRNAGRTQAIPMAITWFFENEPEGIILEEECLPADSFFGFCSSMLEKYRNDERIGHISGSNFQQGTVRGDGSYYFSTHTHIWGWAGWRRVWKDFDMNMEPKYLFEKLKILEQVSTLTRIKDYWNYKLEPLFYEKSNYWRFQYSYLNIYNNRLSVVPNSNLIAHIGYPKKIMHYVKDHPFAGIPLTEMDELVHPSMVVADMDADVHSMNSELKITTFGFYGKEFLFVKNQLMGVVPGKDKHMKIPKIIHQIYFDMAGPPAHLSSISQSWKEKQPEWEYRFWNKQAVEQFLESDFQEYRPLYDSFPYDVQRWDFVRYLILYRLGGLYADMDYECVESLDPLLWNHSCCMGLEPEKNAIRNQKPFIIGNALMASVPGHDFLHCIIKDIAASGLQNYEHKATQVIETTGPFMLNRVYEACERKEDITLLPAELVAPLTMHEVGMILRGQETQEIEDKVEKAFAIHYFLGSWVPQTSEERRVKSEERKTKR